METHQFKARPGPMFVALTNGPSEEYGQVAPAKSSNGTAGSSPFASFGAPFKVPSRRILYEPEEAASSAAQLGGKLSSFALPLRASPAPNFSSSDHKDHGTDTLPLPSKRHKTSGIGALQDQNPSFGKPPTGTATSYAAASKASTFSLGEVPQPRTQFDKSVDSQAVLGKRQREAEIAVSSREDGEEAARLPPLLEKTDVLKPVLASLTCPDASSPLRKSSESNQVSKAPLTLSFGASPKAPSSAAFPARTPLSTSSSTSVGQFSFQLPSSASKGFPSTSAQAPKTTPSVPRALPPLVSDNEDKPPAPAALFKATPPAPKLGVAPLNLTSRSSISPLPSIRYVPPPSPSLAERSAATTLAPRASFAPKSGVGIDFFPRAISAKGSAEPKPSAGALGPQAGHRLGSMGTDPLLAGMIRERGARTVPDARHVEELETTFLNKAQEFSKRLEDMNEGLADAAEKLKEQAVHLFVLNNEALFMNSPALSDRIVDLRAQLKAMRVDTDGFTLTNHQEKEE